MDYNECLELIGLAEAYDTEQRSVSVNVYDLGPVVSMKDYDEKEASKVTDFVDAITEKQATKQADEAAAPTAQQKPAKALAAAKKLEQRLAASGAKSVVKEGEVIAKELESLLAATGQEFSKHIKKKGPALVLPTLSLQDQISELEKISSGLDSYAFNDHELKIIKLEVGGLSKNKTAPADDFQKNLAVMRDSRLKEVSSKLGL